MIYFYHPQWPVFLEDNHVLAIYKPAGLMVQGDISGKASLLDLARVWLKDRYGKPGNVYMGLVHRLDGPVAGVVLLAKTSKAASRLSAQFRQRKVEKRYLAVVHGQPPARTGHLEHHLIRRGRCSRVLAKPSGDSRRARLAYETAASTQSHSLMEICLDTGRRHQIRAQLAEVGCPIVGDRRYGAPSTLRHGCIALLAHGLSFDHPTRPERIRLTCDTPIHWPWEHTSNPVPGPLWSIEAFEQSALGLPFDRRQGVTI